MKKKWIANLVNGCAIFLIVASLLVLMVVVLTPLGQVPQVFGFSMLRVITGSMEPTIPEKSVLVVRQTDPHEIVPGDIICFFSPDPSLDGVPVTHRVQEVSQQEEIYFITKGDANAVADTYPVSGDRLIGKMVFSSAGLGKIIGLLSNPLMFVPLILVPMLAILMTNLIHSVRLASELARKEEEAAVRQVLEELLSKHADEVEKEDKA